MLFRSNCVRPIYVVRGYDEGGHVVAEACVHNPNQISTVRSMLFFGVWRRADHGGSIETMKFDGWRVIG